MSAGVGTMGAVAIVIGSTLGAVGGPVLDFIGHPAPEPVSLGPTMTPAEQATRIDTWQREAYTHRVASIAAGAVIVLAGVIVIVALVRRVA